MGEKMLLAAVIELWRADVSKGNTEAIAQWRWAQRHPKSSFPVALSAMALGVEPRQIVGYLAAQISVNPPQRRGPRRKAAA